MRQSGLRRITTSGWIVGGRQDGQRRRSLVLRSWSVVSDRRTRKAKTGMGRDRHGVELSGFERRSCEKMFEGLVRLAG